MFMCREANLMDPLGAEDDVFGIGSFKEKITAREQTSSLLKGRSYNGLDFDGVNDPRTVTVFLTPPSSPNSSQHYPVREERDQRLFVSISDNSIEDDDVFRPRSTKDLKSMLIRDCMWNGFTLGESPNRPGRYEKFRSLTKTPPLVDCNLRITVVDPCEIWPFSLADQIKAGSRSAHEEAKLNGSECAEEDVEVDVVGLEGAQKVPDQIQETSSKECEKESWSCSEEKPASPLTPSASDDEYSCKLRSCLKRKRANNDTDRNDCIEQKQRVSSGDESDQDCEVGRATHNVLERKRRNELKLRFQYLRDSIPELTGNDRAPKVAILQKAFSYMGHLKAEEKRLMEEARKQKNLNAQLLKRLLEMQKFQTKIQLHFEDISYSEFS